VVSGSGGVDRSTDQADVTPGTARFKAVFSNNDNVLFPNQFVNARLLVEVCRASFLHRRSSVIRNRHLFSSSRKTIQ